MQRERGIGTQQNQAPVVGGTGAFQQREGSGVIAFFQACVDLAREQRCMQFGQRDSVGWAGAVGNRCAVELSEAGCKGGVVIEAGNDLRAAQTPIGRLGWASVELCEQRTGRLDAVGAAGVCKRRGDLWCQACIVTGRGGCIGQQLHGSCVLTCRYQCTGASEALPDPQAALQFGDLAFTGGCGNAFERLQGFDALVARVVQKRVGIQGGRVGVR